jgi:hypothetical protein
MHQIRTTQSGNAANWTSLSERFMTFFSAISRVLVRQSCREEIETESRIVSREICNDVFAINHGQLSGPVCAFFPNGSRQADYPAKTGTVVVPGWFDWHNLSCSLVCKRRLSVKFPRETET